ncbi:unnamed protein product [Discosporangium mesarthrocarpum]
MKFGKNIARVVELSDPEWAPFWINYKFLKKKVKSIEMSPRDNKDGGDAQARTNRETIARSDGEVAFYKLLMQELEKSSDFFNDVEKQFLIRKKRVLEGWRQLTDTGMIMDGITHKRLMEACVFLYKDLLLLENYAIMNYCGFSKILKKHDKVTGFLTREHFMRNVANKAPFVLYPRVIEMLLTMEKLFNNIEALGDPQGGETKLNLSEEQLFIENMRTINLEALKLQQQEGADIGLKTPGFSQKHVGLQPGNGVRAPDGGGGVRSGGGEVVGSRKGAGSEGGSEGARLHSIRAGGTQEFTRGLVLAAQEAENAKVAYAPEEPNQEQKTHEGSTTTLKASAQAPEEARPMHRSKRQRTQPSDNVSP